MPNDIQTPPTTLPTMVEPVTLLNIIAEVARTGGNVEALDRLIQMQERTVDREREIEANKAYARMYADIPQIEKKGKVDTGKGKYSYAQSEDIDEIVRPILAKHGFALRFYPIEETDRYILMEGELIHEGTGWVKRAKHREDIIIGPGQNRMQASGSSQTYAIRYLRRGLLDIVVRGEDTDGAGGRYDPKTKTVHREDVPDTWTERVMNEISRITDDRDWLQIVLTALKSVPTDADLKAFEKAALGTVHKAPVATREAVAEGLAAARYRLAPVTKPTQATPFETSLIDAYGENATGEIITDPKEFITQFRELWDATFVPDRASLLEHNANALAAPECASLLAECKAQLEPAQPTGATYAAIRPPLDGNNGPLWPKWLELVRASLVTIPKEDLTTWTTAQIPQIKIAHVTQASQARTAIQAAFKLAMLPSPPGLETADDQWVADVTYALQQMPTSLDGRTQFDALARLSETQERMRKLRQENPDLHKKIYSILSAKALTLPKAEK